MNDLSAYFDPAAVNTPANLSPSLGLDAITGVPVDGAGLTGAAYAPGDKIWSIDQLNEVVAANDPDASFIASMLGYGARESDTTIAEFLGDDAASIVGDGDLEMGPSGLTMTGYIFIPAGVHEISVISDDGFMLRLGGRYFSQFQTGRSADETGRVADFDGGLYQIDLSYFDSGGAMRLTLAIDGLPVQQSALYQSVADFQTPPEGTPLVPVADYHPSHFLGAHIVDGADVETGTAARDVIDGLGGDDTLAGAAGDDEIRGGYGDDSLDGGDGDDVLDGGRGSDLLRGGAGDDLLISRSDAGEQRIGQLAIGAPTRGDPDNEVNAARQKLKGWESQPLIGDDVLIGGEGADTFLISPQINAKLEIIEKHVRSDGTINWAGVAGENNELHDHWVDSFGIEIIADYVAGEDQIAVIGHTANVELAYRDTDGDGDRESIITVISNQHGGGGAHDRDLIGQIIVHGDRVEEDDIITDANVTYGMVETIYEVAEALFPVGPSKTTTINGETVHGYDTRDDAGGDGPITGAPEDFFDNPYVDSADFAAPTRGRQVEETRYPFEPLPVETSPQQIKQGDSAANPITQTLPAPAAGLPGAVAFYDLGAGVDGGADDARGGPAAKAYTLYENQALLRTDGAVEGPRGPSSTALGFNGEDQYAFVPHTPAYAITQGTIAIWVKPDDLSDEAIFLAKDQRNKGDGGHFRLGHTDTGGLILRFAPGDGDENRAWETRGKILDQGEWAHIAVNFTETGVKVFVDGAPVANNQWRPVEGDDATPGGYLEAYLLQNEEPWVLGADQAHTNVNDTAQMFAADDRKLDDVFTGALAEFGVWGGSEKGDALTRAEIGDLIANGPGAALTNPSGPRPLIASDDAFAGGDGADTIEGGAGADTLNGDADGDSLLGGYGDDVLLGGAGADTLDGGRGSDLLIGGAGNDLLISRADVGEDRAGQLVLGAPSRDYPDPSIDRNLLKLVDWIDQPLAADDILIGGEGADHFLFETLINAKKDIILDNILGGSREIDWSGHGVAGENRRIHDHWVDGVGIEIVADYDASKDSISVIGHTTNVTVSYRALDANDDGVADSVASIITAYSQQGNGGGAHDEDILGYIVVHGDIVREDDVAIDPGVHYGVVDTIDQLQDALAPTGETKVSIGPNGETLFGYDTRDVGGDPMAVDPETYSSNAFADDLNYASQMVDVDPIAVLSASDGGAFDGASATTIAHEAAHAPAQGALSLTFTADVIDGDQALYSKDHKGYENGGHLTVWLDGAGRVKVRLQDQYKSFDLRSDTKVEAGETAHIAFTFDVGAIGLYVNGALEDAADGAFHGLVGNAEDAVLGASTRMRIDGDDQLDWFFTGDIADVALVDRALTAPEAALLAASGGDIGVLTANVGLAEAGLGEAIIDETPFAQPEGGLGVDADGDVMPMILGDGGDNMLVGGEGAEMIIGVAGADTLVGQGGEDVMEGGDGADMLAGGDGADVADGGDGGDMMLGGGGRDALTGGEGADTLKGGGGRDELFGGGGADKLRGGGGRDTLNGGDGRDKLVGNGGRDELNGDDGRDMLRGGGGRDTLDGGAGRDMLIGGGGRDVFTFADRGRDTVRDFRNGQDKIHFDGATGFDDLTVTASGTGTVVTFKGVEAYLRHTDADALDAGDFIF